MVDIGKKNMSRNLDVDTDDPEYVKAIRKFAVLEEITPEVNADEQALYETNNGRAILNPNRMARKTRTISQREVDLIEITPLYLQGYTQLQLLAHINKTRPYKLTRNQIFKDIQEIYRRWRLAYLTGINEIKIRELARTDMLENTYWEAWERSKVDFMSVRRDEIIDELGEKSDESDKSKKTHRRVKTQSKKEQRDGNPKFLEGVQWCIAKRCEILGLNSDRNININWRNQAKSEGLDPESIIDAITEKLIAGATDGEYKDI